MKVDFTMLTAAVVSSVVQHQNISTIIFVQNGCNNGYCCFLMMMMMINCFCGMVDRRNTFSLISSGNLCQRSSPSRISDTPRAGFESAQNLSSGFVGISCAVVIITTPRSHSLTVSTWRNSAFISAINKILKAKCLMHNFHCIDNSNIKTERLWKDSLHLNRSGKDLLTNNFLRNINHFLKLKR